MGWKTIFHLGKSNLNDNGSRIEALGAAREYLKLSGVDKATREELIRHEKEHLSALPEYPINSGKRTGLVVQRDASDDTIRLALTVNRKHSRKDIEASLKAVNDPSEGDQNYGLLDRFRKR